MYRFFFGNFSWGEKNPESLTFPAWGKGKSSTQKCRLGKGYVSSQEGDLP